MTSDPLSSEPTNHLAARGRRVGRLLAPVGVVALALGGVAAAQAATGGTGTSGFDASRDLIERAGATTPTSAPATTTSTSAPATPTAPPVGSGIGDTAFVPDAIADGRTQTFAAGAAGTVTISRSGATLTVVATTVNPGWTREIEVAVGPEVEVVFASGATRIDVEAELEDGGVRVRIRARALTGTHPGAPADPRTDSSGPGSPGRSGGSDDDRSDDRRDDRSGSGSRH